MAERNSEFAAAHKKVMKTIRGQVAALRKRKASRRTPKERKVLLRAALGALSSVQRVVGGTCQKMGGISASSGRGRRRR